MFEYFIGGTGYSSAQHKRVELILLIFHSAELIQYPKLEISHCGCMPLPTSAVVISINLFSRFI